MRDVKAEDTVYLAFTTRAFATGIPTTLAGSPVVSAYEDAGLTQITAGITLSVDHDGVTGFHMVTVVATAANGYDTAKDYALVITTGTVGGVSVVGEVIGEFSMGMIPDAVWDEVLTGASHNVSTSAGRRLRALQDSGAYANGAVWIDTVNGVAGTTDFENGTVSNPVDTIASAITIAASVGLRSFHVLPGSAITLAATLDDWEMIGHDYTLALGGQSVDKTHFQGSSDVTGTFTGAPRFTLCSIGNITGPGADLHMCGITGTITANTAADWFIHHCFSKVAGTAAPIFDFGTTAATSHNLNIRAYSGGIDIRNMGQAGTDTASIEGNGQVIFNVNCIGGTASIRGNFTITDNGSATLTTSANNPTLAATAQADLDTITGASGVNLLTATQASIDAIEADTGTSLQAELDGIQADTEDIQSRLPAALVGGRMDSDIGAKTGNVALSTQEKADVNTEVVDARSTDTLTATAQGAPSTTPTLEAAIMTIYDAIVHGVDITATLKSFKNNAGTVIWKKTLSDDGTTYSEAESVTGP